MANDIQSKNIRRFTNRIKLKPRDYDAYLKRGLLHFESENWNLAIKDFTQVIKLNPSEIIAYYNRGNCYFHTEKYSKAIEDYSSFLSISPDDLEALNNRAVAYERTSQYNKAISDYRQAIKFAPGAIIPRIGLSNTLNQVGKYNESINISTEAISISETVENLYFVRGCSYYELGKLPEAKLDFERSKSLGRKDGDLSLYLGKVYFRLLDPDNAIIELNFAIDQSPRKKESTCYRFFSHCLIDSLYPERFNKDASLLDLQVILEGLGYLFRYEFLKAINLILDQKYDKANDIFTTLSKSGYYGVEAGIYFIEMTRDLPEYNKKLESYFLEKITKEKTSHEQQDLNQDAYQENNTPNVVVNRPENLHNYLPVETVVGNGDIFLTESQIIDFSVNSNGLTKLEEIPFSSYEGSVKFIRTHDLPKRAKDVMNFTFDHFLREEVNLPSEEEKLRGDIHRVKAFNYRRFAGGSNLPRGKYYSICDSHANDNSTLAFELKHYYDPKVSGEVEVYDLADTKTHHFLYQKYGTFWSDGSFPKDGILLVYKSRNGCPNPIHTFQNRIAFDDKSTVGDAIKEFPLPIRFSTKKVELSNVIDLRRPEVQNWLVKSLNEGIYKTYFVYIADNITSYFSKSLLVKGKKIVDFYDILPSLMCYHTGGTPVTEAIARWLRYIGANALIYPSARANPAVEMKNGDIINSYGWCLVDYTDSESVDIDRIYKIYQPDEWGSQNYSLKVHIYSEKSPSFGSWKVMENLESLWHQKKYDIEMYYQSVYYVTELSDLQKKQYSLPTLQYQLRQEYYSIMELKAMLNSYGSALGMNLHTPIKIYGDEDLYPLGQIIAITKETQAQKLFSNIDSIEISDSWFLYANLEDRTIIFCPVCDITGELANFHIDLVEKRCPNCFYPPSIII